MSIFGTLLLAVVSELFPLFKWELEDGGTSSTCFTRDAAFILWVTPIGRMDGTGCYVDYTMWCAQMAPDGSQGPSVSVTDTTPTGLMSALATARWALNAKMHIFAEDDEDNEE